MGCRSRSVPLGESRAFRRELAPVNGATSGWGLPAHLEVLTAGLLAILALLALVRMPRARLRAGGALVGIGAVLVLHLIGIVVHIAYFDGVRVLRWGGALGIEGGLLLVIGGARVARAESAAEAPGLPVT